VTVDTSTPTNNAGPGARTPPAAGDPSRLERSLGALPGLLQRFGLPIVWGLVALTFTLLEPSTFPTSGTFSTIFGSQSVLLILALALLLPFSVGEYDLSVAGVLSLVLVLIGYLNVVQGWPLALVLLVAIGAGALIGAINAFFIVVVGVDSIVVTLGMGTVLTGAGVGINNQTTSGISDDLVNAVSTNVLQLPLSFFYGFLLTAAIWYLFSYTPLGRYLYFVGSGRDVARLSGLRVDAIRAGSLIASATLSAVGGIVLAGTLGAADPNIAAGYLLPAFAAAFLGATAITPGRFNPWGTFVAVYFLVTGVTGLNILGLTGWVEQVFYGASLVLAVTFSHLAARRRRVTAKATKASPVLAGEGAIHGS
jgi:ribose transport system permease protein